MSRQMRYFIKGEVCVDFLSSFCSRHTGGSLLLPHLSRCLPLLDLDKVLGFDPKELDFISRWFHLFL